MKRILSIIFLLLLFLSSCTAKEKIIIKELEDDYAVYETIPDDEESQFNQRMADDPITVKMAQELREDSIAGANEANAFFSKYLEIWKEELSFSIRNLKTYLSKGEALALDQAQTAWEDSVNSNNEFDAALLKKGNTMSSFNYIANTTSYIIDQYQARAFHIKYMTYLIETNIDNPVPQENQMWNQFHDFTAA